MAVILLLPNLFIDLALIMSLEFGRVSKVRFFNRFAGVLPQQVVQTSSNFSNYAKTFATLSFPANAHLLRTPV